MARVRNTKPRLLTLPYLSERDAQGRPTGKKLPAVKLRPGQNIVDDDYMAMAMGLAEKPFKGLEAGHPGVLALFESEDLVQEDGPDKLAAHEVQKLGIFRMDDPALKATLGACEDRDTLQRWLRAEKRVKVQDLIHARAAELDITLLTDE